MKEDETIIQKVEEKQCNNPLAGLANAVNAITNGINSDESLNVPVTAPVTVNSKQAPPKAMVKPQVLTHVIEGFVIQEGINTFFVVLCLFYYRVLSRTTLVALDYNVRSKIKICFPDN